jgi:hypothetical protein
MKLRHLIAVSCAAVFAFGSTGCVMHEGGFRVAHQPPPPPPPPVIHRGPEVVVATPPPRVVVAPPSRVVVAPQPTVITPPPAQHVPPGHSKFPQTPAGPIVSTPSGQAQMPPGHSRIPPGQAKKGVVVFTSQEREVICNHVKHSNAAVGHGQGNKHKGVPPGQAKKAARTVELPPNWQQQCVVGQVMPQEIYRHCEPLPQEVVVKLPPPPVGTIVVTLDSKAVRLAHATLEILDVFDVFH